MLFIPLLPVFIPVPPMRSSKSPSCSIKHPLHSKSPSSTISWQRRQWRSWSVATRRGGDRWLDVGGGQNAFVIGTAVRRDLVVVDLGSVGFVRADKAVHALVRLAVLVVRVIAVRALESVCFGASVEADEERACSGDSQPQHWNFYTEET